MQFALFFAFMDFRKLIDMSKLARKFEGRDKWRSWEPKHKLLSYWNYTLLRKEICSVIYLFAVTGKKACQDSLTALAHGQVLSPYTKSDQSQGHKDTPGLWLSLV